MDATPRRRPPARGWLHPLTRALAPMHALFRGPLRRYFASTPGWVLLTTYGRRTGRPHEVPLPCARTADVVIVVSAYGERSDWMRNIRRNPGVIVTWAGRQVPAIAEVVDHAARRQDIVSAHPFVGFLPLAVVRPIAEATLWLARPAVVALLRRFVEDRPVVVLHVTGDGGTRGP